MECRFINLDSATERRSGIERAFREAGPPTGWTLERFPAVSARDASTHQGKITDAEKGCLLSHRELLRQAKGDGPILVLEDDATFSPQIFAQLPAAIAALGAWDVLFTDAGLGAPAAMMRIAYERQRHDADRHLRLMDLASLSLCSSSAYVVNGASRARLVEILDAQQALDAPYDLVLRQLLGAGEIKGFLTVPYLTSIAAFSSQIAERSHEGPMSLFRRTMFIDRDDDECEREAFAVAAQTRRLDARWVGIACAGLLDVVSAEG